MPEVLQWQSESNELAMTPVRSLPAPRPVHAHIFGRPMGAIEFINALEVAQRYRDWAWLTDHRALADLFTTA
jgi:hypothetical protein